MGYGITQDGQQDIHGQIVIVNNGPVPLTGWRIRVVLPGDTDYQVLDAANRSAGDALVMAAPLAGQAIAAGSTEVIVFTARGTTSTPARSTFTDSGRPGLGRPTVPPPRGPERARRRGRPGGVRAAPPPGVGGRMAGRLAPGRLAERFLARPGRRGPRLAWQRPARAPATAGDRAPAAPRRPVGFVP